MIIPVLEGLTLTKGHAGGIDAILFPDLDAVRTVTPEQISLICDRRRGIGADAVMRVVRTAGGAGEIGWRIDAWDSSGVEMPDPGSLVRLAAHYLRVSGLIDMEDGQMLTVETAAGPMDVTRVGAAYAMSVDVSAPVTDDGMERGFDVAVTLDGVEGMKAGLTVRSDRTSVVVAVEHEADVDAATGAAQYDPDRTGAHLVLVFPEGDTTIVDFDGVERPITAFRVRSFSNGSEQPAGDHSVRDAAIALYTWAGEAATGIYHADSAGHRSEVRLTGGDVEITGPAEIVAEFMLTGIAGEGR